MRFFVRVALPWAGPESSLTYVFEGLEAVPRGRFFEEKLLKIRGTGPEMLRAFWTVVQSIQESAISMTCINQPEDALRFATDLATFAPD